VIFGFRSFSFVVGWVQENVKVVQENAKDLYKQMTPLLQKCLLVKRTGMPPSSASMENRRAGQQADNLVWQQEAFHKILKLQGLLKEGLICKAELQLCRKEILQVVAAVHPDGEWANFTRDKLLFLQVWSILLITPPLKEKHI
jgi:hypothetical protein